MISIQKILVFIPFTIILLASCAGGPSLSRSRIELPEEQTALLAGQIEDAVLYVNPEPDASAMKLDEKTGEVTGEFEPLDMIIGPDEIREKAPMLAQLHADTEPMLSAIRGRILRRSAVYELQQAGCLGETRDGFLKTIKGKMCSGDAHEQERGAYIVLLENRDRRVIYEQLAGALKQSNAARIQQIFAEEIYKKAWAGTPVETSGGWEKK
jgi:uncharacterized protein YdbL (DUF1318 family)